MHLYGFFFDYDYLNRQLDIFNLRKHWMVMAEENSAMEQNLLAKAFTWHTLDDSYFVVFWFLDFNQIDRRMDRNPEVDINRNVRRTKRTVCRLLRYHWLQQLHLNCPHNSEALSLKSPIDIRAGGRLPAHTTVERKESMKSQQKYPNFHWKIGVCRLCRSWKIVQPWHLSLSQVEIHTTEAVYHPLCQPLLRNNQKARWTTYSRFERVAPPSC
jgi:hypothetical protein